MNWNKFFTIGGSIAGLIVSMATIIGGVSYYVNQQYVPRNELMGYYSTLYQNNEVILNVMKTIGTSFYDATILDVETAIETLNSEEHLNAEQHQQLELLKLIKSRLIRDKDILENMKLPGINVSD